MSYNPDSASRFAVNIMTGYINKQMKKTYRNNIPHFPSELSVPA